MSDAVQFRLVELETHVQQADSEVDILKAQLESAQVALEMEIGDNETTHAEAIRKKNSEYAEEYDADESLTTHFKNNAKDACINTIMKQQDILIHGEQETLISHWHEVIQAENKKRVEESNAAHELFLAESLKAEEEVYLNAVRTAILAHEERMRGIDN